MIEREVEVCGVTVLLRFGDQTTEQYIERFVALFREDFRARIEKSIDAAALDGLVGPTSPAAS